MRLILISLLCLAASACDAPDADGRGGPVTLEDHRTGKAHGCSTLAYLDLPYTVCTYRIGEDDMRLFHSDAAGDPYLQFDPLARELDEQGLTLKFAMNGGMYHEDRSGRGEPE